MQLFGFPCPLEEEGLYNAGIGQCKPTRSSLSFVTQQGRSLQIFFAAEMARKPAPGTERTIVRAGPSVRAKFFAKSTRAEQTRLPKAEDESNKKEGQTVARGTPRITEHRALVSRSDPD